MVDCCGVPKSHPRGGGAVVDEMTALTEGVFCVSAALALSVPDAAVGSSVVLLVSSLKLVPVTGEIGFLVCSTGSLIEGVSCSRLKYTCRLLCDLWKLKFGGAR